MLAPGLISPPGLRWDSPSPWAVAGATARPSTPRRRSRMSKREPRLFVRVTDEEHDEAKRLAEGLGLTVSDLVRVLLRLPAGYAEGTKTRPVLVSVPSPPASSHARRAGGATSTTRSAMPSTESRCSFGTTCATRQMRSNSSSSSRRRSTGRTPTSPCSARRPCA